MTRILTGSGVALAVALLGISAGAQTPQPPKAVPEAPAMGGQPQTKSSHPVIALRANEVALSRVAHASLVHNATKALGDVSRTLYPNEPNEKVPVPEKIGTLTTALLDPAQKKVVAVAVDTDNKTVVLPWSQIQPIHQPHDQFRTAVTAQALAAAPTKTNEKTVDVEQAFIGRSVVDADGQTIGTVSDVVAQANNGTLDYIVVHPSGPSLGTSNAPHAVPWAKLKPIPGDKSQPIKLAVNDEQLAALPVFSASKAQETPDSRAASHDAGATQPPPP
jgi:sporulation protein YlmC with PRC-barrel domain